MKQRKQMLSALLVIAMLGTLLTGCGQKEEEGDVYKRQVPRLCENEDSDLLHGKSVLLPACRWESRLP